MTLKGVPALAAALAGVLALGACGTSQPTADADVDPAAAGAEPITLTDSAGRTVELDAPAERVVVLEWQQVEDVLSLGVEPVGVADVMGYRTWNTAEELDTGVTDVGTRGEPNMDAVFSTDPDLVIAEAERGSPLIKQLEEYDVPVLVTKGADAEEVLKVVGAVGEGEAHFGPEIARRLMSFFSAPQSAATPPRAFPELTEREEEVLSLMARGKSNQEIAQGLFLSLKTVRNHASNIFLKLQVADRAQAVIRAREAGLGHDGT